MEVAVNTLPITEANKARYYNLAAQVRSGQISMNQAYRSAQQDGDTEDTQGFKGTLKQWLNQLISFGWLREKEEVTTDETEPQADKPKMMEDVATRDLPSKKYGVPIAIGVGLGIILLVVAATKKNK